MNTQNYLTLAGVVGLAYGLWFLLAPQHASAVYGSADAATDLSYLILHFFAISLTAGGVMALAARSAEKSIGRTAIFYYLAVSHILYLIANVRGIAGGADEGIMGYVDVVVNVIIGLGAVYFIMQDRK